MRLKNKVAAVTGGGSGIGRATAVEFARQGAAVLVADLDGDSAAHVAAEIEQAGGRALGMKVDISQEAEASAMVRHAVEAWGRLDILVNNAASFHHKRVEEATRDDWETVYSVNVVGTSICCKHAATVMKEKGGGSIVNISSMNGLVAMPDWMTYNATKAAIVNMSRAMAMDLAPFHIRVNCVAPGAIHTPAMDRLLESLGVSVEEAVRVHLAPRCLIKRLGRPEEVAATILYVASDEGAYMTGATVVVDGGYTS